MRREADFPSNEAIQRSQEENPPGAFAIESKSSISAQAELEREERCFKLFMSFRSRTGLARAI